MPNIPIDESIQPPSLDFQATEPADPGPAIDGFDLDIPFINDPNGVYHAIGISSTYSSDRGLRCASLAGAEGEQQVFWRVHSGASWRTIDFVMQKIGDIPNPPAMDTGNANEVLMDWSITPVMPSQMVDGTQIFTIAGRYVYALQKRLSPEDVMLIPQCPIRVARVFEQINPATFDRYLVGPTPPPSGFSGGSIDF